MPIPFRDDGDADGLGSAAFLTIQRSASGACCLGALFVVSARGEPLEFAYNRVRVPHPALWRPDDLRRHLERRLTASLLSVCSHQPRLLLCLAAEVGVGLFTQDLSVEVPVARVSESLGGGGRRVDVETGEVLDEPDASAVEVAWQPAPPATDSGERRLFDHLTAHGLLREPFERAVVGLDEVYGPSPCEG